MSSTSHKLEYDSTLGGPVVLANHVATYRYAADALQEINELVSAINNPTSTKLVFQKLPKHMRRRGMSHHPNRLPRKYRAAHRAQMLKAGDPKDTKRPSRKHRRRPSNLLRDYLRRQRQHVWLETHIWHARRFHMINRWGYRLPYASTDKTYRACYRASSNHCLLQDVSFLACVQLRGTLSQLAAGFAHISSAQCGEIISAKTYTSGRREGSIELFRNKQYPVGALGRVAFLWRSACSTASDEQRTLWLWLHPSSYQAALQELLLVFELEPTKITRVPLAEPEVATTEPAGIQPPKASVKRERQLRFMARTGANERVRRYTNAGSTVELTELKDTLNRFRLTGPLSQAILTQAFKVKQYSPTKDGTPSDWFHTTLSEQFMYRMSHEAQERYWQKCALLHTPTQLMSNMVLALNIEDPRIHRPPKRTKALPPTATSLDDDDQAAFELLVNMPNSLPESALWEASVRNSVTHNMPTTHDYCQLRARHAMVPGMPIPQEATLQPLPVLLIQRPGAQQHRLGYSSGWDIIAPAGYGMPIWLSLTMRGARPGGLREFDTIARELGTDYHLPDTVSGRQIAAEHYAELHAKYFRMPPNRRANYTKLAILSPFRAPYVQLVRDWLPHRFAQTGSFHVLRDRALLAQLDAYAKRKTLHFPSAIPLHCIIQLQLQLQCRGNLDAYALICLPLRADFKRQQKRDAFVSEKAPVYVEPPLPDLREKDRKALRQDHKRLLKRMRARRLRVKRQLQETSTKHVRIQPAGTTALVAEQYKKMCRLWLPEGEQAENSSLYAVRKQCTREVCGYVNTGSFSYSAATVCGVGYATVEGLKQLLENSQSPLCLVRGTTTRNYRFAKFKVNLEV